MRRDQRTMQISSDWEVLWGPRAQGKQAGRGCLPPPSHLPGDRLGEVGALRSGGGDPLCSRAGLFGKKKAPPSGNVPPQKSQGEKREIASRQGTSSSPLLMGCFWFPASELWLQGARWVI